MKDYVYHEILPYGSIIELYRRSITEMSFNKNYASNRPSVDHEHYIFYYFYVTWLSVNMYWYNNRIDIKQNDEQYWIKYICTSSLGYVCMYKLCVRNLHRYDWRIHAYIFVLVFVYDAYLTVIKLILDSKCLTFHRNGDKTRNTPVITEGIYKQIVTITDTIE